VTAPTSVGTVMTGALVGMGVVLASLHIALSWPRPERDPNSPKR
jgi:hypothetical protein